MIAYYAPNKQNENELAKFLDLRGTWAVRDYTTGMRNYSGVKVMQIIEKLKEVDAKSKGIDNPFTSAGELMRELIFSSSIRLLSGSKIRRWARVGERLILLLLRLVGEMK